MGHRLKVIRVSCKNNIPAVSDADRENNIPAVSDADRAAAAASKRNDNGTLIQSNQMVATDAEKNLPSAVSDGDNATFNSGKSKTRWSPFASASAASTIDNGTTSSAALAAVSPREQTASIATGTKSSISSGSTSAFKPVSKSQTSATTGIDTKIDKGTNPSSVTTTPALESPQKSQTNNTSGQDDNDVIDLTDSPPGSPRPPSPSKKSPMSTDHPKTVEPKAIALWSNNCHQHLLQSPKSSVCPQSLFPIVDLSRKVEQFHSSKIINFMLHYSVQACSIVLQTNTPTVLVFTLTDLGHV
jgi:hypothetical protein